MSEVGHIPVIDFDKCGLHVDHVSFDEKSIAGKKIKEALGSVGFCYLKNHGVELDMLDKYLSVSKQFFGLPDEEKQKFKRVGDAIWGWVGVDEEKLNQKRPADLKEAFDFSTAYDRDDWPVPEFVQACKDMFDKCKQLAFRICDVLSVGLDLKENFMREAHAQIGKTGNSTTLRSLYYPPLPNNSNIKPGQIRLGEHSDYGSLTLLYQDSVGGLEVNIPGKGFVSATPIPGTIVVNIGDLMQRWSADTLIATEHRVCIPEVETKRRISRQSMAFFLVPDDDYVIKCLDGSNKYEQTKAIDYLNDRMRVTLPY